MIAAFGTAVGGTGLGGWLALKRIQASRAAAFERTPQIKRDLDYLRANLPKAGTAAKLVDDPRLLRIALTAFGLESEAPKKAFVLRVLEGGTESQSAAANRISDRRYREFARAFGYGNTDGAPVAEPGFADRVAKDYVRQRFEEAVGSADETYRQALYFERAIGKLAEKADADRNGWFAVMGEVSLRRVVEAAFGLPANTAQLDLDRQKTLFESKARVLFGEESVKAFLDPANVQTVVRRYLARSAATQTPSSPALILLTGGSSGGLGSAGLANALLALNR